eukprot:3309950-Amphidinium_carterae.1
MSVVAPKVGMGITIVPDPATCHQKKWSLGPDRQVGPKPSQEPQPKTPTAPDPTASAGVAPSVASPRIEAPGPTESVVKPFLRQLP